MFVFAYVREKSVCENEKVLASAGKYTKAQIFSCKDHNGLLKNIVQFAKVLATCKRHFYVNFDPYFCAYTTNLELACSEYFGKLAAECCE